MHDETVHRAIQANTDVNLALLRWLQSQTVSRRDLADMEARLTTVIEGQNSAALKSMAKRLDKAGDSLADAVANNQPG